MFKRLSALALLALAVSGGVITAQRPQIGNAIRPMVKVDAPVVAITNVRVIDGTGAPARVNQTVVLRDGVIAEIGDAARVTPPQGAEVMDLSGRSVIPGLVMLHEHLYYPTGPGVYGQYGVSFTRLYLAGGVTTMRTGGNVNGVMDITLARRASSASFSPCICRNVFGPFRYGAVASMAGEAISKFAARLAKVMSITPFTFPPVLIVVTPPAR